MAQSAHQTIGTAVAVSKSGADSPAMEKLAGIFEQLDIAFVVQPTAEDAAAQLLVHDGAELPLLVLDGSDSMDDSGETVTENIAELLTNIEDLSSTLPHVPRVIVAVAPSADLVIGAFRAGANDFVDIKSATPATMANVIERVAVVSQKQLQGKDQVQSLRSMVEDFLRNLIKTERRSIDLEHKLAIKNQRPGLDVLSDLDADRDPTVVIVEDDGEVADMLVNELEDAGLATFAFVTGEEAVENVAKMTRKAEAVDLALVDAKLPGMSGLEAIREMRKSRPQMPAIVMTGFGDKQTAMDAADLGVVGYVLKPFDNISGLVERIKEQALLSRASARERHYLGRIKNRHDKLLQRYRELAAKIDK